MRFFSVLPEGVYENLEALLLKLHEDGNDLYSNVHVLHKTRELRYRKARRNFVDTSLSPNVESLSICQV